MQKSTQSSSETLVSPTCISAGVLIPFHTYALLLSTHLTQVQSCIIKHRFSITRLFIKQEFRIQRKTTLNLNALQMDCLSLNSSANLSAKCTNQLKWLVHLSVANRIFSSNIELLERQTVRLYADATWTNKQNKNNLLYKAWVFWLVCAILPFVLTAWFPPFQSTFYNWIQFHLDSRDQNLKIY